MPAELIRCIPSIELGASWKSLRKCSNSAEFNASMISTDENNSKLLIFLKHGQKVMFPNGIFNGDILNFFGSLQYYSPVDWHNCTIH